MFPDSNDSDVADGTFDSDLTDLLVVVIVTALTVVVSIAPVVRTTPVRWFFGFVFILIVPGWALVAALFPGGGHTDRSRDNPIWGGVVGPLSLLERVALSIGGSFASLGLLSVVLTATPLGIGHTTVITSSAVFTACLTVIAANRRRSLPPEQRFRLPVDRFRRNRTRPELDRSALASVFFVICLLVTMGSVGYALTTPSPTERFTEFYLLTEDANGELKADNYPSELTVGEPVEIHVGITNNEATARSYTVVAAMQNATVADNRTRVSDQRVLSTFQQSVQPGDTHTRPVTVSPESPGEQRRLIFMLYRESAPQNPTADSAYKTAHIWVNVSRP